MRKWLALAVLILASGDAMGQCVSTRDYRLVSESTWHPCATADWLTTAAMLANPAQYAFRLHVAGTTATPTPSPRPTAPPSPTPTPGPPAPTPTPSPTPTPPPGPTGTPVPCPKGGPTVTVTFTFPSSGPHPDWNSTGILRMPNGEAVVVRFVDGDVTRWYAVSELPVGWRPVGFKP